MKKVQKLFLNSAFTMAEAILVMTILGIIATIMISTLKPAEFKEKGMQVMAKKVMSELDVATTQIILNDVPDGNICKLPVDNSTWGNFIYPDFDGYTAELAKLYKKYLTVLRKSPIVNCNSYSGWECNEFLLKDGASVKIVSDMSIDVNSIFPGETEVILTGGQCCHIELDINDNEPPNVLGKDRFVFPLNASGINYDPTALCCTQVEIDNGCPWPLCK